MDCFTMELPTVKFVLFFFGSKWSWGSNVTTSKDSAVIRWSDLVLGSRPVATIGLFQRRLSTMQDLKRVKDQLANL